MNDTQTALARRAVACKGWKWCPGMRAVGADGVAVRVLDPPGKDDWLGGWASCADGMALPLACLTDMLPDIDDSAMEGCLLALARKAWKDPTGHVCHLGGWDSYQWCWVAPNAGVEWERSPGQGATPIEALVTALENAPEDAP